MLKKLCLSLLLVTGVWGAPQPNVLKGQVKDSRGVPLAGVKVFADNTLLYNTNAIAVSDAAGKYSVSVARPAGTWHATAQIERTLNGQKYVFPLHPDSDDVFAGNLGAVRNFVWKLQGERPEGGHYGGKVIGYGVLSNPFYIETGKVELTLEPQGNLVDGSVGKTISGALQRTPDGDAIVDVPVARYKITARYLDPENAGPLLVRLRNQGEFGPQVVADFKVITTTVHHIEVEVKSP